MTNAVTLRPSTDVSTESWAVMLEQAKMLVPTGFLPKAIDTPQKAIAVMMKGRELGIPPMYALSNINIIQGKPAAAAELMLALIYRDQGDDALVFTETSATKATAKYKRRGWAEYQTFTFNADDAKRAGLTGGNWDKYPGAMLRARCISAIARLAFPDFIGGMYTPEEMGATVDMETGEIIDSAPSAPPQPRQTAQPRGRGVSLAERIHAAGPEMAEPDEDGVLMMYLADGSEMTYEDAIIGGKEVRRSVNIQCANHESPWYSTDGGESWSHGRGNAKCQLMIAPVVVT